MLELIIGNKKYSKIFEYVELSGSFKNIVRTLKIKYLKENLKISVGEKIILTYNSKEIFQGKIFKSNINANELTNEFVAYDDAIYLQKNFFVKNYFERVPSEIVKEICKELQIETGIIPIDTVKCTFPAINKRAYEIILRAYTIQHNKDKKIYSISAEKGKINIINNELFLDTTLDSKNDIRSSNFSEDISDMINQFIIYKVENDKPQILEKVANEEDKKEFGLFQNVLEYEEDMNNILNAKDMLKNKNQKATLEVNGNIDLRNGYSVGINEVNTGLVGSFFIESDKHVWSGDNDYITTIQVNFEKVMNKVDFEDKRHTQWSEVEGEGRVVID